jgi:hypothetical protein
MIEVGILLPTRESVMSGRPAVGPMLALAERAESLGFSSVWGRGLVASLPPLAARLAKESLLRGQDIPNLPDASLAEGHRAWREKRKPAFRGR